MIQINNLYVITYINGVDGKPRVYPKAFTCREDAKEILPHIGDGVITTVFLHTKEE